MKALTVNDRRQIWESTADFYRKLAGEGGDFDTQIELIRNFVESEYLPSFLPTISHHSLCFTFSDDYDEMQYQPLISVTYMGNRVFEIEYRSRFVGYTELKIDCEESQLWDELKSLFLRYRMEALPN